MPSNNKNIPIEIVHPYQSKMSCVPKDVSKKDKKENVCLSESCPLKKKGFC